MPTVTEDYFYADADDKAGGGSDDNPGGFMLEGLDPSLTYDFRFFGSRSASTETRVTEYRVFGANAGVAALRTGGNNVGHDGAYDGNDDTIASLSGIRPDAQGQIFVDLAITQGTLAYLNAFELRANRGSGWLTNLSIRSTAGAGDQTLIVGVSIGGAGAGGGKNLLVRGVGPALSGFGVVGPLADPRLELFAGQASLVDNDNWDATATPSAMQAGVGAFSLAGGSKDAALQSGGLPPGNYTIQLTGVGGSTGVALVEISVLP